MREHLVICHSDHANPASPGRVWTRARWYAGRAYLDFHEESAQTFGVIRDDLRKKVVPRRDATAIDITVTNQTMSEIRDIDAFSNGSKGWPSIVCRADDDRSWVVVSLPTLKVVSEHPGASTLDALIAVENAFGYESDIAPLVRPYVIRSDLHLCEVINPAKPTPKASRAKAA